MIYLNVRAVSYNDRKHIFRSGFFYLNFYRLFSRITLNWQVPSSLYKPFVTNHFFLNNVHEVWTPTEEQAPYVLHGLSRWLHAWLHIEIFLGFNNIFSWIILQKFIELCRSDRNWSFTWLQYTVLYTLHWMM